MNTLRSPESIDEFTQYYQLRWQILRKPWQQPLGSEQDEHDKYSIHRMFIDEHGAVQAVGRLEKINSQVAKIRYMAVSKHLQRQGLGKKIISELEQQAMRLGFVEITLNSRENTLKFYQKLGYKSQGLSHTLFGVIKHFRLTKKLTKHPQHQDKKAQALTVLWHKTIEMSKAMNLQISYFDGKTLITHCDAKFNKNLHNTMFAGSIYTLATLTGWGWVYFALQELTRIDGDIVLAQADIRYHSPIKGLTFAKVDIAQVSGNFDNLVQGKNARIKLTVNVFCGEHIAATFNGSYFILPKSPDDFERIVNK